MARKKSLDQEPSVENTVTVAADRPDSSTFNTSTIMTSSPVAVDNDPPIMTSPVTVGKSSEVVTSTVSPTLMASINDVTHRSVEQSAPIDDVTATPNTVSKLVWLLQWPPNQGHRLQYSNGYEIMLIMETVRSATHRDVTRRTLASSARADSLLSYQSSNFKVA